MSDTPNMPMARHQPLKRPPSNGRLLIPVASAGLLLAVTGVVLMGVSGRKDTASSVLRTLRQTALTKADKAARDDGGMIGPWHIAATSVTAETGVFEQFRLSSGNMQLAAARAKPFVLHETDEFGFELWDVVLTRIPEGNEETTDHHLVQMDHHTLGPVPWGRDIVADQ